MAEHDELLPRDETARILTVGVRTLERWAKAGIGPRSIKVGPRAVRYRRSEVSEWLDAQTRGAV